MNQDIYCNPLPLPDLGQGICCRLEQPDPAGFCGNRCDFREIADPEMLYYDGVWYMYPSVTQAYVSRDLVHWEYHPLQIDTDLGYAPSITRCGNRFLLTASVLYRDKTPKIYSAPAPLGPYTCLGEPKDCHGRPLSPEYLDPSLFTDEDGRLYLYWGYAPGHGICGVELSAANPLQAIGESQYLIDFKSGNEWEHYGEYYEHCQHGWNEGAAMFKHRGVYYLQYACCGTNLRHYAVACYRSSVSPLGPFIAPDGPMLCSPHGIVSGTGHGGMVAGPEGSVWQFYTCLIRRSHMFERRVGMDRVQFAEDGTPSVKVTSTPQSIISGDQGLVPVSCNKRIEQSSWQHSNYGAFAVDECTHTWWAPDPEELEPWLKVNLVEEFDLSSLRIIWCEINLNYQAGIRPEPVRFVVEFFDAKLVKLPFRLDRSSNMIDHNIEFLTFPPVRAQYAKLTILRGGSKIHHGITDFTLFAKPR